jgi:hypothetical protein
MEVVSPLSADLRFDIKVANQLMQQNQHPQLVAENSCLLMWSMPEYIVCK